MIINYTHTNRNVVSYKYIISRMFKNCVTLEARNILSVTIENATNILTLYLTK